MKARKHGDSQEHRHLATFAADCAEHVLPFFGKTRPQDDRPRKAIEAARAWARGEIKCGVARTTAFAAHAVARDANDAAACAAARASAHAAATAHTIGHARHAAASARKAATAAAIPGETERDWQVQRLPEHLRSAVFPSRSAAGTGDRQ